MNVLSLQKWEPYSIQYYCWLIIAAASIISAQDSRTNSRQYTFDIQTSYAPLLQSLDNIDTAIYSTWPDFDKHIPDYATIASTHPNIGVLMSQPIHVIEGDILEVTLINHLDSTGLSIHWHGFEMKNSIVYDGVVGITQCPLSPQETMVYRFEVDETPGTYWYHTHSGPLGVNALNEIKAPLIVHPRLDESEVLVNALHDDVDIHTMSSYDALTFYSNERILFFADGFLISDSHKQLKKVGGLNPPISKNDDGFTVGSFPYDFGTCNGKLREVIPVTAGKTYKFRLLNGGTLYGFRISIDGLRMRIIAADSEPVEPYEVDDVILHSAERFDVEVDFPTNMMNRSIWVRADTLESSRQGYQVRSYVSGFRMIAPSRKFLSYSFFILKIIHLIFFFQNGVRAILHVVPDEESLKTASLLTQLPDPVEDFVSSGIPIFEKKTMNCNSRVETQESSNGGECLPVTELISLKAFTNQKENDLDNSSQYSSSLEHHTVDFEFSPPPAYAHFVRIDNGLYYQHVNPINSHFFQSNLELHENTAMMHLSSYSSVLITWRNKSLMDHPIHLHGYKMEILDVYKPMRELHCSRASCKLPDIYDSEKRLRELDVEIGHGVLKDTFILPAGGAVVTRIQTFEPAVWFAHCHLTTHSEDGMALIVNVGALKFFFVAGSFISTCCFQYC